MGRAWPWTASPAPTRALASAAPPSWASGLRRGGRRAVGLVATARTVGDIDGDAPARARELFVVPVWADRSFHALLLRAERAGIMRRVRELEKIHLVCGAAVLCVHTRTDEGVKRGRQSCCDACAAELRCSASSRGLKACLRLAVYSPVPSVARTRPLQATVPLAPPVVRRPPGGRRAW